MKSKPPNDPEWVDPKHFLIGHFEFAPLPAIARQILQSIESGSATAKQVAALLESEPSLVAQVLKIVNSAYYALPRRVSDVRHAVAYLGLGEIHRLVLTASVMARLKPSSLEQYEKFWYHSFLTALTARRLAQKYERTLDPGHLHTTALLHDLGKLVYMTFFPEAYKEIEAYAETNVVTAVEAERFLNYPCHTALGRALCERWDLPTAVAQACAHHELEDLEQHLQGTPLADYLRIVTCANLLCNLATAPCNDAYKAAVRKATSQTLGCDDDDFLLLMGEIYELRTDVERVLEDVRSAFNAA